MARKRNSEFDFETAMQQLDTIVGQLETGGLSLEDSLKQFEQGIKLTRECQKALKDAEQKVQILMGKNSDVALEDFTLDEDDED